MTSCQLSLGQAGSSGGNLLPHMSSEGLRSRKTDGYKRLSLMEPLLSSATEIDPPLEMSYDQLARF